MRARQLSISAVCMSALVLGSSDLGAQSYDELTLIRNMPSIYASVIRVRAGASGSIAKEARPSDGLDDEIAPDGFVYYRNNRAGDSEAVLDAYAGRDGFFVGLAKTDPSGGIQRLELTGRAFPFYREGFYRDGDFIPTGRYEGTDYGAFLAVGNHPGEGLSMETGPYVRQYKFERNDTTDSNFTIPEDYLAYGLRAAVEHNTLQLDRDYGMPHDGFIATLQAEVEMNDSSGTFGTAGVWESSLPSRMWRARGHLEWYFPASGMGIWELRADGGMRDKKDRVSNFDAQLPMGQMWADASVGFRFNFGGLSIAPEVRGQWIKSHTEDGFGTETDIFYGAGADLRYDFGEAFRLVADYSYLTNQYQAPVSAQDDIYGEHSWFVGMEIDFGAARF